jgi:hypothetical protein
MWAIEEPKLWKLTNTDLEGWVEQLNQRINIEEARSCGSRLHVKLLQEYEEVVNNQNIVKHASMHSNLQGNYYNTRKEDQDLRGRFSQVVWDQRKAVWRW